MQYVVILIGCKHDVFLDEKSDIFHIFAQNVNSGYMLYNRSSNVYPQSLFCAKKEKKKKRKKRKTITIFHLQITYSNSRGKSQYIQ